MSLVGVPNRSQLAHRFVYTALVQSIAADLQIDHLCRVRCCVNPDHLELVTLLENVRRGDGGRNHGDKTHCPQGHEYAGENLKLVDGRRRCLSARTLKVGVDAPP